MDRSVNYDESRRLTFSSSLTLTKQQTSLSVIHTQNQAMNEGMNERTNERSVKRTKERRNERTYEGTNERMN